MEHNINRSGTAEDSRSEQSDGTDDTVGDDTVEEQRSEAEIKRELRESVVGRVIIDYAQRRS